MNNLRRTMFNAGGGSVPRPPGAVDKSGATVGSVCISNGTDIWFMTLADWQAYSGTEYQAIGVTVAAVGDCGDDLVRICSIPYMNCNTPDVGSMSDQGIFWNGLGTVIKGGITETTNINTVKADYNGKANTAAILAKATSQPDWRTDSTITNSSTPSNNTYFPAACCCWRFNTLGTQQGDWYLPAAGELYKGSQNKTAVDTSLQALGMTTSYDPVYWSSTSYSSTSAWAMNWSGSNTAIHNTRRTSYRVRAFTSF